MFWVAGVVLSAEFMIVFVLYCPIFMEGVPINMIFDYAQLPDGGSTGVYAVCFSVI